MRACFTLLWYLTCAIPIPVPSGEVLDAVCIRTSCQSAANVRSFNSAVPTKIGRRFSLGEATVNEFWIWIAFGDRFDRPWWRCKRAADGVSEKAVSEERISRISRPINLYQFCINLYLTYPQIITDPGCASQGHLQRRGFLSAVAVAPWRHIVTWRHVARLAPGGNAVKAMTSAVVQAREEEEDTNC